MDSWVGRTMSDRKLLMNLNEPQLREVMLTIAKRIEGTAFELNIEKPKYVVILFNDPAIGQYISNCSREDCIKAIRETADRLERREDIPR